MPNSKNPIGGQATEPPKLEPLLLTMLVAVAITGFPKTRLQGEIKAGRLRTKKIGRRTMIVYSDLVAFVDALPEGRGTCPANTARGAKRAA